MRARNRHSASNYLFAAFLELVIMGLFVIIAQPQLRESLFKMLETPARAIAEPPLRTTDSPAVHGDAGYAASDAVANDGTAVPNLAADRAGRTLAQPASWPMTTAAYTPLEQFEAFTVSTGGDAALASAASFDNPNRTAAQRVAGYAPPIGPTQLNAIDWNIASAHQSPRPLSGWTAPRAAPADYRDTYPPPYGTQSQWK